MKLKVSCICILLSFFAFTVEAQSFSSYLAKFKVWKGKTITSKIFYGASYESFGKTKKLDRTSLMQFIPRWSQTSGDVVMDTYTPTYIIKKPHFIASFLYHQSINRTDPNASFYSYEVVIYTNAGKILDNATVVMGMDAWIHDISGTLAPLALEDVKKANLSNSFVGQPGSKLTELTRITFGDYGTIHTATVPIDIPQNAATQKTKASKPKRVSFRTYLKMFSAWRGAQINDSLPNGNMIMSAAGNKFMDDNCVARYIPKDFDCECESKNIHYAPEYIIEQPSFIVAFLQKVCGKTVDEYWPYNDLVMITYSKDGDLIDNKIIGRSGDMWNYCVGGTLTPLKVNVNQQYHVITAGKSKTDGFIKSITTQYTVSGDGKILSFN